MSNETKKTNRRKPTKKRIPVLPVKELVVFPNCIMPLYVGRKSSLAAVDAALDSDRRIFLATQKNPNIENPQKEDLYSFGTVVEIVQSLNSSDGNSKLLVEGKHVSRIITIAKRNGFFRAQLEEHVCQRDEKESTYPLTRVILSQFERYFNLSGKIPEEIFFNIRNITDPDQLTNAISTYTPFTIKDKIELLEAKTLCVKLNRLSEMLSSENEIQTIENRIIEKVKSQIGKSQKEYFLNEQLKVIERELGLSEDDLEFKELEERIEKSKMSKEAYEKASKELTRLSKMPPISPEATVARTYIEWLVDLPWSKRTKDKTDIERAQEILDQDHYGLKKIKERIIEYLAVHQHVKMLKGPILCFVGPPGVGKTSLGRSIARALGRKFVRISLGGVRDEAEIRGHRRTYVGALPGKIIQSMKKAHKMNPVFLLDEVDKMSVDFRGDPSSALLEVLDPEQNKGFNDHYMEIDFDLSSVLFITTANTLDQIPYPLMDRMEILRIPGYTYEEKRRIAELFLIPKQIKIHGLTKRMLSFSTEAVDSLIDGYTREAGVRNLEREIANICRKIVRKIVKRRKSEKVLVTPEFVRELLGPIKFKDMETHKSPEVGVVTGLAWTEVGGEILPTETTIMNGKGELVLTGKLGEVMQESAKAALSYIRSRTKEFHIRSDFYKSKDIHIHIPEGAVSKDGPSAGITMATSMISALSNRPVRQDIAMTGEITLRGKVLKIGGLKEKVLAAHRAHIKTIIIPKDNKDDLEEISDEVKKAVDFICVDKLEQAVDIALIGEVAKQKKKMSPKRSRKTARAVTSRRPRPLR